MSEDGQHTNGEPDQAPAPHPEGVDERAGESALDALEADLAAVEHAIERLDRVTEQGIGGDDAAHEIAVAVPVERFDLPTS